MQVRIIANVKMINPRIILVTSKIYDSFASSVA
jgi:hypothetical protein